MSDTDPLVSEVPHHISSAAQTVDKSGVLKRGQEEDCHRVRCDSLLL